MSAISTGGRHEAGRYEIRLKGHLDSRWAAWFDEMSLTNSSDGTSVIHGPVVDQAALHGLLQKVRDLGLPLVSVTHVDPTSPMCPPSNLDNSSIQGDDMTTTAVRPSVARGVPMTSVRKTALVAGGLYLITIIASIPALILKAPALNNPDYIVSSGAATAVLWGNFLDVITALACIGTAVALFPVVKRQNQAAAIGFVAARVLEAALIFIGVVSLLSVVTLRQDLAGAAGADAASLVTVGTSLVAVHDWANLLGPGVIPGVNALLLGYLLYRSGLVPRAIPLMGLIGAPLLLASATATLFGINEQFSVWSGIAVIPIAAWELSLGVWLVVKGFKPSPITAGMVAAGTPPAYRDVAV